MNYSKLFKTLLGETFSAIQYKNLPIGIRVLAFIAMLPFIAGAAVLSIVFSIYCFTFDLVASGTAYLETWVAKKKEDISNVTEAVLYFVTMPFIFASHIVLSLFSSVFFLLWFIMQCCFYIATLGGIKWQPYINRVDENGSISDMRVTTNKFAAVFVISELFVLYISIIIIALVRSAGVYMVSWPVTVLNIMYYLGTPIVVPILFRKSKIQESTEETETVITAEQISEGEAEEVSVVVEEERRTLSKPQKLIVLFSAITTALTIFLVVLIASIPFSSIINPSNNPGNGNSYNQPDFAASAYPLTSGSYIYVTTEGAYYKYVAQRTGSHTFYSSGNGDVDAHFYDSDGSFLTSDSSYGNFSITESLVYGQTYYIFVRAYSSSTYTTIYVE